MRVQATDDGDGHNLVNADVARVPHNDDGRRRRGHSLVNADVVRVPHNDDDHPDAQDARAVTSDLHCNVDATSSNIARLARSMQLSGLRDEVLAEHSAFLEAGEEFGDAPYRVRSSTLTLRFTPSMRRCAYMMDLR